MLEFFVLLGAMLAAAGLHSAYEAGREAGAAEALRMVRADVFRAAREETSRSEVSRQELQGSYRIVRRLVTALTRETT